jgi:hypothetical protein
MTLDEAIAALQKLRETTDGSALLVDNWGGGIYEFEKRFQYCYDDGHEIYEPHIVVI